MRASPPRPVHPDVAFRYHLRNRFNPNHAQDKIAELRVRRGFFALGAIACLTLSIIAIATVWFLTQESFMDPTLRMVALAIPAVFFWSGTAYLLFLIVKERKVAISLAKEIEVFELRYECFLKTVGLSPSDLDPLSDRKIEKLCEELLGNEAKAAAAKTPRAMKARQKRLNDIYDTVTHIGYGKKALEDYIKRANRKPKAKKSPSRRASA